MLYTNGTLTLDLYPERRAVVAIGFGRFGAACPAALSAPKSCVGLCFLALVTFALKENEDDFEGA